MIHHVRKTRKNSKSPKVRKPTGPRIRMNTNPLCCCLCIFGGSSIALITRGLSHCYHHQNQCAAITSCKSARRLVLRFPPESCGCRHNFVDAISAPVSNRKSQKTRSSYLLDLNAQRIATPQQEEDLLLAYFKLHTAQILSLAIKCFIMF
jgi:hypothetical protein